jgi:hypothetical protein
VDHFPDVNQDLLSSGVINEAANSANSNALIPEVDQIKREDSQEVHLDILWKISSRSD